MPLDLSDIPNDIDLGQWVPFTAPRASTDKEAGFRIRRIRSRHGAYWLQRVIPLWR
jgi:hypothetical protein